MRNTFKALEIISAIPTKKIRDWSSEFNMHALKMADPSAYKNYDMQDPDPAPRRFVWYGFTGNMKKELENMIKAGKPYKYYLKITVHNLDDNKSYQLSEPEKRDLRINGPGLKDLYFVEKQGDFLVYTTK